jgi:signal transduction histidine kinase
MRVISRAMHNPGSADPLQPGWIGARTREPQGKANHPLRPIQAGWERHGRVRSIASTLADPYTGSSPLRALRALTGTAAVNTSSIVERLAALPSLTEIPREQLQWLVDHGQVLRVEDGQTIRGGDEEMVGLLLLISGRFSVRLDQGGVSREVREVTAGHITGYAPYSRLGTTRAYVVADGPVEFLLVRREHMKEMTRACYEFTAACVHEMLDRTREYKADDKHQEKMAALGRLSAGLAHELNNPASAVARAAGELANLLPDAVAAAQALGAAGLTGEARLALHSLEAATRGKQDEPRSPVDRADREDRVMAWLEGHGADADLAYPLVEHGLTVPDLDVAALKLRDEQLGVVLRYVAVAAAARGLTSDISSAAARIHALVAAVKKHTHMDRGPAKEPIRLPDHLRDTVTLMSAKAALKGVALDLSLEDALPPVDGFVADLNQVWMHLVDNAIDAAPESGRISIDARRERDVVVVRVVDDGPGIPAAEQERVFEPFFTTKHVGEGRGLGLDIVRTVVLSHMGAVELTSTPGRTEFRVTLPAADTSA